MRYLLHSGDGVGAHDSPLVQNFKQQHIEDTLIRGLTDIQASHGDVPGQLLYKKLFLGVRQLVKWQKGTAASVPDPFQAVGLKPHRCMTGAHVGKAPSFDR